MLTTDDAKFAAHLLGKELLKLTAFTPPPDPNTAETGTSIFSDPDNTGESLREGFEKDQGKSSRIVHAGIVLAEKVTLVETCSEGRFLALAKSIPQSSRRFALPIDGEDKVYILPDPGVIRKGVLLLTSNPEPYGLPIGASWVSSEPEETRI
jgi:hypothetical protein